MDINASGKTANVLQSHIFRVQKTLKEIENVYAD
jgi:hypothetical protein